MGSSMTVAVEMRTVTPHHHRQRRRPRPSPPVPTLPFNPFNAQTVIRGSVLLIVPDTAMSVVTYSVSIVPC